MKDLVSVIIPCYSKQRQYLKRAVASVKKQTHKNIELIVVDDDNISATEARNIGINKANGEYIAFLDADDEWNPTKIEKQLRVMREHPDCPIVVCYSHDKRFGNDRINKPPEIITHKMILKSFNLSSTSSYFVRSYALNLYIGFDITLPSAQEYDLAIRLSKHHNIRCVPEILVTQNSTKGQISENWTKKIKGIIAIFRKYHKELSPIDYIKTVGIITLFSFGFILGNKIYKIIIPIKGLYEE